MPGCFFDLRGTITLPFLLIGFDNSLLRHFGGATLLSICSITFTSFLFGLLLRFRPGNLRLL